MLWPVVITVAVLLALLISIWLVGEHGHAILPSTRRGFKEFGLWRIFLPSTWQFYLYGCWPMKYIGLLIHHVFAVVTRLGYHSKRWFADRYHGKILTPEHAKSIITVDRKIPLQDLDQVVPYGKRVFCYWTLPWTSRCLSALAGMRENLRVSRRRSA